MTPVEITRPPAMTVVPVALPPAAMRVPPLFTMVPVADPVPKYSSPLLLVIVPRVPVPEYSTYSGPSSVEFR
jgi:hypothetical protein